MNIFVIYLRAEFQLFIYKNKKKISGEPLARDTRYKVCNTNYVYNKICTSLNFIA